MSDANVVGRWVTDAGDERAGSFTCCGEHLEAPHNIPSPFYEGQTRYYVYCPACALAHFGVRPPGTETCGECGASPCDCDEAVVWSFRVRSREEPWGRWGLFGGGLETATNRQAAVAFRETCIRNKPAGDTREFGPVQRITDPPFDFDAAAKTATECGHAADDEGCRCWGLRNLTTGQMCRAGGFVAHVDRAARWPDECAIWAGSNADATRYAAAMRRAHGGHAYEAQRHSTLTVAPTPAIDIDPEHYAGPARCHLDWCSAPTRSTFCSSNCERAHEDRIAATTKLAVFRRVIAEKEAQMPLGAMAECDMAGEVKWAERHTEEAVETIRRAWSALRHEQPQGSWVGLP